MHIILPYLSDIMLPKTMGREIGSNKDIEQFSYMVHNQHKYKILFSLFSKRTSWISVSGCQHSSGESNVYRIIEKKHTEPRVQWLISGMDGKKAERKKENGTNCFIDFPLQIKGRQIKQQFLFLGCNARAFNAAYITCHKLLFAIMPPLLIWRANE